MKTIGIIALVLSIIALIVVGYSQIDMQRMKKAVGAAEQRLNQKVDKLEEEGSQVQVRAQNIEKIVEATERRLNQKIEATERKLNQKREAAEQRLNQKVAKFEEEQVNHLLRIRDLLELIEDDLRYLREKEILPQGFLGVGLTGMPGGKGVLIEKVYPGSPAARAGLEKGDIILAYNGRGVLSREVLISRIKETRPETPVEIVISRRGEEKKLVVRLGSKS